MEIIRSGKAAVSYSRGDRGVRHIAREEKGRTSGNFRGCCRKRKRATQIEFKNEKEYVTHTPTCRSGTLG